MGVSFTGADVESKVWRVEVLHHRSWAHFLEVSNFLSGYLGYIFFDIYCGRDESVVQNEVEHIKLAYINLRCGFCENEVQYVSFLVGGISYMLL